MGAMRDATDLGVSWRDLDDEPEGDVLVVERDPADVPGPGSTAAGRRAAWRLAGLKQPARRVPRVECRSCFAQAGHWCKTRRSRRIVEVPGRVCKGRG